MSQNITAQHREHLRASGLSDTVIDLCGAYSALAQQVSEMVGFEVASGGIVFPYSENYARVRLDEPIKKKFSKPAKYICPVRSGNKLYIPANFQPDSSLLIITEGEKKALKACQEGLPCIGTAGVWSWKSRNEHAEKQDDADGLLRDFDKVDFQGVATVALIYDSDIVQAHPAWDAYPRLAEQLYARGAKTIKILSLPSIISEDEKTGLDDFLLRRTKEELLKLIQDAPVWIPWRDGVQGFAMPRIDKAAAEMKRTGSGEPAYWDSTLQALCAMALRAETEFARGKAILTATGVAYDKAAINKHIKTLAAEFRARQEQSGVTTVEHAQVISDEQLGEWRIPSGWRVDEEGVWLITEDKPIRVSPVQIVLTARLLCRDDNTEKIRVGFRRDGELKTVDSARSTVFSRAKIVELADFGLPISTETAKNVVRYLHEFEICNFDLLPSKVVTGHFGWFDARNFLPGVNPDGIQFSPAGPGDAQIAAAYREKGEIAEWVQLAAECRKHPFVRAALAGSFAAPLMRDIGFRPFIVYLYGESEGGKSAALALAMSAWGEPEGLKASFNATKTATEKLAHLYSDLPLWLDERQVVDRTERGRQMVDALMYIITQGRGRGRGSKGGGLQTFSTWRTVALTCGEDPIVETETATGVRVRAIELFGKPFEGDDALARRVYEVTAQHHGLAGPEFIKRYLAEKTDILAGYEHALKYISERYGKKLHGTHTTVLAILMVADMASAMWIFGQDEDDAFKSAEQWINVIAQEMVQARNEGDWAYRAMEFTRSWIAQNWDKFNHKYDDLKEHWGWTDNEENDTIAPDTIYIFPAALQSALQKQGFSPGRARREWAKRGWIEVDEASKQTTVVKRVPWLGKAQRVIALKNVDAGESSE